MDKDFFMRNAVIDRINGLMRCNGKIIFLSCDFGAPSLDRIRSDFKDRFINVGIAEQNLINVCTGYALEGFTVFAYGISTFVSMRCFEQIRNLSLISQIRKINVNIIGVGGGLSYDISGPSHHSLEDMAAIRTLSNIQLFSPSDYVLAENFVDYAIKTNIPKYIRLDGKKLPAIYNERKIDFNRGFSLLRKGYKICLVSTGYMTQKALKIASKINAGVIDVFMLNDFDKARLSAHLIKYKYVATMEEGFKNVGGLDTAIAAVVNGKGINAKLINFGFSKHIFEAGDREYLHLINGLDENSIISKLKKL